MANNNVSATSTGDEVIHLDSFQCIEEVLSDSVSCQASNNDLLESNKDVKSEGNKQGGLVSEKEEKPEYDEDEIILLDSDDEEEKEPAELKNSVEQINPEESIDSECLAPEGPCDVVGSPTHAGCQPIFVSHVFKNLPPIDPLANVHIRTPLEFMLYAHIAKSLAMDVAREVIEKIRASDQPLLKAYHTHCKGLIFSLIFSEAIFRNAFEMRLKTCRVAFSSLKASGQKRIHVAVQIPLTTDDVPADVISEWRKVFDQCRFALDELRAKMIFPNRKYLRNGTVLIGDSEAKALSSLASAHLITEKTPKELLETVRRYYFSSTTKALLLCWGADDLRAGLSEAEIVANIVSIADVLKESSVRLIVVPPAFNQLKAKIYNRLLPLLDNHFRENAHPNVVLALVSRTFRSLTEVTRYGNYYNQSRVNKDGRLTREGKHQTLVHLKAVYHIGSFYNVKYADMQNTGGSEAKKSWSLVNVNGNKKKPAKMGLLGDGKSANVLQKNANAVNNANLPSASKQTPYAGKKQNQQSNNNKRRLPSPIIEVQPAPPSSFNTQPYAALDDGGASRKRTRKANRGGGKNSNFSPWLSATDYSNIAHADYLDFLQQQQHQSFPSTTNMAGRNEPSPWITPSLYGDTSQDPYYADGDYSSHNYQPQMPSSSSLLGGPPKNRAFGLSGSNTVELAPNPSGAFSIPSNQAPRGFFGASGGRTLDEVYALQCLKQYNQPRNF